MGIAGIVGLRLCGAGVTGASSGDVIPPRLVLIVFDEVGIGGIVPLAVGVVGRGGGVLGVVPEVGMGVPEVFITLS